jgi:pseudouridine-5'-monophosphatase
VIYDLDGVLLDTEPIYTRVTQEIVARWGKTFDWSIKRDMIGRPSLQAAQHLVRTLELPIDAHEYLALRRAGLEAGFATVSAMPGAERFTRALADRGITQAIATSSERGHFDIKSLAHRDWFAIFAAAVTGDDRRVGAGKPAPDIFLVAARAVGAAAERCMVVEDSPAGVEAARSAGMRVVAMPDPEMDRARYADADLIVPGFEALMLEELPLVE